MALIILGLFESFKSFVLQICLDINRNTAFVGGSIWLQ